MFTFHKTLEAFRSIFSSKESSLLHVLTPGTCQSLSTSTLEVLSDAINNPDLRKLFASAVVIDQCTFCFGRCPKHNCIEHVLTFHSLIQSSY